MTQPLLPGGALSTRPLHFIWIADCSGSMDGEKIQALNFAIREALPAMRDVADENPNANVLLRAVSFSTGAKWHIPTPTSVDDFQWVDLSANGLTDMGKALRLVTEQLKMPPMEERALPPVLVLISDGQPTDDFKPALVELMALPWGKKAVRLSIAIGEDADLDVLQQFIGHNEMKPLVAKDVGQLVNYIRWASTVVLKAASSPASKLKDEKPSATNVPLPPPPVQDISSSQDVF